MSRLWTAEEISACQRNVSIAVLPGVADVAFAVSSAVETHNVDGVGKKISLLVAQAVRETLKELGHVE